MIFSQMNVKHICKVEIDKEKYRGSHLSKLLNPDSSPCVIEKNLLNDVSYSVIGNTFNQMLH